MGLDLGEKTIGVAMSDPLALTAQPVKVIKRSKAEMEELNRLIAEYAVEEIVLGYPRNMNGTLGERLSTVGASRALLEADLSRAKRKKVIDKMAAVFILQGYLDSRTNI
jgi:putative Holliday junction resolvase